MHKIDHVTAVDGLFTEGDPENQIPATVVKSDWTNAVQTEIVNVVEGAGLALDKPDNAQLREAILGGLGNIRVGSSADVTAGKATHTTANFAAAVANGDNILILPSADAPAGNMALTEDDVTFRTAPGASFNLGTYSLTLSGARNRGHLKLSAAAAGKLILSGAGTVLEVEGADYQVFALSNGARGKVLGAQTVKVLSGSGTWDPPTDIQMVDVFMAGGGGGGGGGDRRSGSTTVGGGGGGGGGVLSAKQFVSSPVAFSVGVKGAKGVGRTGSNGDGTNGGDGTETTFDTLLAKGGKGGRGGTAGAPGNGGDGCGAPSDTPGAGGGAAGARTGGGGGNFEVDGGAGASSQLGAGGTGSTTSVQAKAGGIGAGGGGGRRKSGQLAGQSATEVAAGGGGGDACDLGGFDGKDGGDGGNGRIVLVY